MAEGHKDYSGTSLTRKLGIREGSRVLLVDPPADFAMRLEPLPPGVTILRRSSAGLHVVVLFAIERASLARRFGALASSLRPDGRLWVAWPTKASKVRTDIAFGDAQGIGLAAGLVDNKSASLTEVFQGLQFVYRLKDRPRDHTR